jgi:hypothetical protein
MIKITKLLEADSTALETIGEGDTKLVPLGKAMLQMRMSLFTKTTVGWLNKEHGTTLNSDDPKAQAFIFEIAMAEEPLTEIIRLRFIDMVYKGDTEAKLKIITEECQIDNPDTTFSDVVLTVFIATLEGINRLTEAMPTNTGK